MLDVISKKAQSVNLKFVTHPQRPHYKVFSIAVSTAVLIQSVLCKPNIFTKQPKIARQCTPSPRIGKVAIRQRPLVEGASTMISIAFMFS